MNGTPLPPIDIGQLRIKAASLFHLAPWMPVHFTSNGIATQDESDAMVTLKLEKDGSTVQEHWHCRYA